MKFFYVFFSVILLSSSCTFDEGVGGRATITGKVFVQDFNQDNELIVEDYAPDWEVFIVYGDDDFYGDSVVTHFDGTYEFDRLYEGNYTLYAYSKCNSCPNNIEPIFLSAEITEAEQVLTLPDLVVID